MRPPDLTRVIFPVAFRPIFFDEPHNGGSVKVQVRRFQALIDERTKRTFSVVGSDYKLVTNRTKYFSNGSKESVRES